MSSCSARNRSEHDGPQGSMHLQARALSGTCSNGLFNMPVNLSKIDQLWATCCNMLIADRVVGAEACSKKSVCKAGPAVARMTVAALFLLDASPTHLNHESNTCLEASTHKMDYVVVAALAHDVNFIGEMGICMR